ncbi:MAG: Na/Pi symporter [Fidelibacterota bacterium]|nr:MAG: Na/Pi symporter [Candidatus Neomarinimicrobiota bacterium]
MSKAQLTTLLKVAGIMLFLYLFIVGIGAMGQSFKLFGKGFSEQILSTTASPMVGLFIGILATSLVQSSSTTTSIVVGMVAGGAISIQGAIPIIMGANIGTTVTNTIVSIGHITRKAEFRRAFAAAIVHDFFNIVAVAILFPLELTTGFLSHLASLLAEAFEGVGGMKLGSPLKAATTPAIDLVSDLMGHHPVLLLILSVLLIFLMLAGIVKTLRSLVIKRISAFFDEHLFKTASRAFLFGMLLTSLVQSSSITTSLAVPLVGAGLLTLLQVFPYTLGANIGTTITAILAALSTANPAAITVAFAHLMFNVSGRLVIWPVKRIRHIPIRMAEFASKTATRNRFMPLIFIVFVFYLFPLILIALTR